MNMAMRLAFCVKMFNLNAIKQETLINVYIVIIYMAVPSVGDRYNRAISLLFIS